jgi:hypothetical protein
VGGRLLCYDQDKDKEQVITSNTAGGLEDVLINHLTSNKGHYETSQCAGFPMIFLCLPKDFFISTHVYI